ncbi:protein SMALL AUXIN UP-REGULATED RNA 51-like [Primulina huaijiensis]|uniref:protein SMALL AUXIN UP-REGULATED RNA 51-like n=1 Tax=Primulina huaijiensis TaxID=1492673 RepID=UPI003CC7258A
MASAIKKVNMIARIVRLRQVVRSWKAKSLSRLASRYISPYSDDPDASARRTPSGSVAVYVGQERRRFVIPTRFLNMPVFGDLLHEAEEEFGFQTNGGLLLPCEPSIFEEILRYLEEDEEKFCSFELNQFLRMCSGESSLDRPRCKESSASGSCHGFTPLLQNTRV